MDVVVDPYISAHLRPHQQEGVKFLYECVMGYRNFAGQGAILAWAYLHITVNSEYTLNPTKQKLIDAENKEWDI